MDFTEQAEGRPVDSASNRRIHRVNGEYGGGYGKHLPAIRPGVRAGKGSWRNRGMGPDYGNGDCIRNTGGNRGGSAGTGIRQSTDSGI